MGLPNFPCPECGREVEYYDTAKDGKSGRYRCECGRDTIWKTCRVISATQLINKIRVDFFEKGEPDEQA